MAKIINRISPEVLAKRNCLGTPYVTINARGILFSRTLMLEAGIEAGKYVHFINEDDYWAFFVNRNSEGFPIIKDKHSFRMLSTAIAGMFIKSTGRKQGERFYCLKSSAVQNDSPVFEIYSRESTIEVLNREKKVKEQRRKVLQTSWKPREINAK